MRAINVDRVDCSAARDVGNGVGDGRPIRLIGVLDSRDEAGNASVGVDDVNTAPSAFERDSLAVRRPGGVCVVPVVVCETPQPSAVLSHCVYLVSGVVRTRARPVLMNAIRVPSGDQTGYPLSHVCGETRLTPRPSLSMMWTASYPRVNAIFAAPCAASAGLKTTPANRTQAPQQVAPVASNAPLKNRSRERDWPVAMFKSSAAYT